MFNNKHIDLCHINMFFNVMKIKNIVQDFKKASWDPFDGFWGRVKFYGSASIVAIPVFLWVANKEENRDAEYGNINPENHLFDNPSEEDKADIIGTIPTFMRSYFEDDRRVHARYSTTPEYQVIGYLLIGTDKGLESTCTAQVSVLPDYKHVDGKTIITTIDHCIPENLDDVWMNFSARLMQEDGSVKEFTSPVDLDSVISFPDCNPNNFWSLFVNKEKTESPVMAFLEVNAPDDITPLTINTEWDGQKRTSVIQVGNSSDRYGTTLDNQCVTSSHVFRSDYSVKATCHGTKGSSGGPLFELNNPTDIIAITSLATAFAKRGNNNGTYVTFPSRDEFDYGSIPWLRKISQK
jgi:hypothetical protein